MDSTKRDDCDNCAFGTASTEVSLTTPCPTCPSGFAAPKGEGNTACSACLAGKFQEKNSDDEMICTNCEAGQYTDSSNAPNCTACDPGDYQNKKGKTACLPCVPVRDFLIFFNEQSHTHRIEIIFLINFFFTCLLPAFLLLFSNFSTGQTWSVGQHQARWLR